MILLSRSLILALLAFSFNISASDLAKEKRWADQVVDGILDGEAVWLNNGQHDFLGIYTEAEEEQGHAVIIMHGSGIHPDWQQVIQPLRVGLIEHGWNTLSIQMPVLHNEAEYAEYAPLYPEATPRIEAAIQHLKTLGSKKIVLIGHSQGASMAAHSLATAKHKVDGFIAIGMASFADDPRMNSIKALENIHLPVLDLYADEDIDAVVMSVDERVVAAIKAGNKDFKQIELKNANHFFDNQNDALISTVANWLNR